jgi:hypothetical protein
LEFIRASRNTTVFYTLDSYQNNYALEYKEIFRKVISAELEKSPNWEYYFVAGVIGVISSPKN